ncbi:type I polyketide synthase [Acidobacterium sp. S8]|uniref:type I polyketide synthase n=1 Tax=Acidobacterium sp. S8 TaxID=1641854 RepID=UPI00131C0D0B|nr:type I polyketide synthase [Acidobacterium sp. S8]
MSETHFKSSGAFPSQTMNAEKWSDSIAIVGMGARFPGARNVREFWKKLEAGDSLISTLSENELRVAGVESSALESPDYVRRGGMLEDAEFFDAKFFGFNRREAEITDPQHRVFLETAWEALEDSGYIGDGARIGVYAGVSINSYFFQLLSRSDVMETTGGYQLMLGNDKDFLATRVAYKLNLRGPAVVVQTACSTSLAAVHLACQSILTNECDMALAGGVSIPFPQGAGYLYIPGMILSPDGYCRPFDKDAKGTVPGRGAAVVVLKRLSQALKDDDSIYAVIRGSAWNNDGARKIGYTAPSIEGQAAVIRDAQRVAGITPDRIGYIEAHGTATELGDPIEVAALTEVFAGGKPGSCVLGALKANLGHADVAAGIAGLVKAALAVQAGVIPPTPNFREPSPALALDKGPFIVSSSKVKWADEGERWAGVSSFGIGGTNVHVVLSSAPQTIPPSAENQTQVFPLSARTESALTKARERLAVHLETNLAIDLAAVASTLQVGRKTFDYRFAVAANDATELTAKLREASKNPTTAALPDPDVVFLFPGQGQQFIGMAAGMYRTDAAFCKTIDRGAELVRDEFDIDLLNIVAGDQRTDELESSMRNTSVAQPVLFLTEYALAARWRSLGVQPEALLGHSLGELTAAAVAGVFSFEDGLRLAAERGRLMDQTPEGIMLAVTLPPDALSRYLGSDLWFAAENTPRLSVASGLPAVIEELEQKLAKDRIASVRLASKNAFHTPLMADAAKAFREKVAAVPRKKPDIPWLSNVTGTWIDPDDALNPQYWANQILSRVRFTKCVTSLGSRPRILLETGPGEALAGMARQQWAKSLALASLGTPNRKKSDDEIFMGSAAHLWQAGVDLAWRELPGTGKVRRIPLPTYPFEREKFWIEKSESVAPIKVIENGRMTEPEVFEETPVKEKRQDVSSWFYMPGWKSMPPASINPFRPVTENSGTWLVLLDSSGLGELLADRLEKLGAIVVAVSAAQEFSQSGHRFSINPGRREDYERLWRELNALGVYPSGLICLWTIGEAAASAFDRLILLLQSARLGRQPLVQIDVITDRLEQVLDETTQNTEAAEVCGLMHAVPVEFPGTDSTTIDVDLASGNIGRIVEQIISEVRQSGAGMTIAYRGMTRWQKTFTTAPLLKSAATAFRQSGTYLITGGIGGIGYVLARHLLREYKACVVLTGRTALPPPELWTSWLEKNEIDDTMSVRIRRMQELAQLGGQVEFVTADVTNREAMAGVITQTRERYGRIHGVVHAAGLPGGRVIAGLDPDDALAIRAPKVQGSIVIADLLKGSDIDFLLFCSSISAAFPGLGQAAYAAANEFQNYFARYLQKAYSLPAVAIDFDAWRDVGMAATMEVPEGFEDIIEEWLRTAMTPEEGIDVIERVLGTWTGPQILTSTVSLEILSRQMPQQDASSSAAVEVLSPKAPAKSDPEIDTIVEIWSDLLADKNIGVTDNFFELGGHSLLGTMVLSRIRERLGVVLTLRMLFEAPTPETLAERIRFQRDLEGVRPSDAVETEEREEFEI